MISCKRINPRENLLASLILQTLKRSSVSRVWTRVFW